MTKTRTLAPTPSTLPPEDVIAAARIMVLNRNAYYSTVLFALRPYPKKGYGTLGVDKGLRMAYDPDVVKQWGVQLVAGVLVHELNHVLRDHHGRCGQRHPMIWNVAGDLEINDDVIEAWPLPEGVLTPDQFELPDGLLAEEYYPKLQDQAPQLGNGGGGDGQSQKAPGAGGQCGGCASGQDDENDKGDGDGSTDGPKPEPYGSLEVEAIRKVTAEKIVEAEKQGRGSVPAGLSTWAKSKLEPPKVPWQKVLQNMVRVSYRMQAGQMDYTYSVPSRRQRGEILNPSMRRPCLEACIVVDTSGSMSGRPTEVAVAESMGIIKAVGMPCTLIACDAAVHAVRKVASPADLENAMLGGGGTDMAEGVVKAVELGKKVIVLITDGDTPWPTVEQVDGAKMVVCIVGKAELPDGFPWAVVRVELDPKA